MTDDELSAFVEVAGPEVEKLKRAAAYQAYVPLPFQLKWLKDEAQIRLILAGNQESIPSHSAGNR